MGEMGWQRGEDDGSVAMSKLWIEGNNPNMYCFFLLLEAHSFFHGNSHKVGLKCTGLVSKYD